MSYLVECPKCGERYVKTHPAKHYCSSVPKALEECYGREFADEFRRLISTAGGYQSRLNELTAYDREFLGSCNIRWD